MPEPRFTVEIVDVTQELYEAGNGPYVELHRGRWDFTVRVVAADLTASQADTARLNGTRFVAIPEEEYQALTTPST